MASSLLELVGLQVTGRYWHQQYSQTIFRRVNLTIKLWKLERHIQVKNIRGQLVDTGGMK